MGCLKLHTEENYTTLKVVYNVYKSCVLTEQEEKNKSSFLEVVYKDAQSNGGSNGGGDKLGLGFSSADVGIGFYSGYLYNHNTYSTLGGAIKNIFKANGAVRSAQAAKYAKYSKFVKGIGVSASVLSTAYSGYKIANGTATTMDKVDFGVGAFGLGAGAAGAFGIISNPVGWGIGVGVGIYGGARLLGDVIGDYNPGGNGVGQYYDPSTGLYMIK